MHWLAVLLLLFQPLFSQLSIFAQQAAPEIHDMGVSYRFGEQIAFQAQVEATSPVKEVVLFLKPEGQQTAWQKMTIETGEPLEEGQDRQVYTAYTSVEARQIGLYPFSNVAYHYEGLLDDGTKVISASFEFQYQDDRFTWQQAANDTFQVSWYSQDSTLGQAILNAAGRGYEQAQTLLQADLPRPLRIYAYETSRDLQTALQINNQPWVAGHATPELGMILISVPTGPEQKLEMERQVPHEIMHILQYQVMGERYNQQPVWLVEGMASLTELYPNPEYQRVLEAGARGEKLLPMASLCAAFPNEAGGAFLAYAQADSFVRFLQGKFGATGLRALIDQYQNGLSCEEGVSAGLGVSFKQLEYRWKQEALGLNTGAMVLRNLSPYLIIGLILVLPIGLALIPARSRPVEKKP